MSKNYIEVPEMFEPLKMPDLPQSQKETNLSENHFKEVKAFLEKIENQYQSAPFPKLIFPGSFFVYDLISDTYKQEFLNKIKELKNKGFPIEIKFDIRMRRGKFLDEIKDDLVLIPANQVQSPDIRRIIAQENNGIINEDSIEQFNKTFRNTLEFTCPTQLTNPGAAQGTLDNGSIKPESKYDYIYAIGLTQTAPVIYIPGNIKNIAELRTFLGKSGYLNDSGTPSYLLHLKIGERTMGIETISDDDAVLTDFLSTERAIEHQTEESSKLYCEIENFIMKHFNTRQKLEKPSGLFEKPFDETGTYILSFLLYCTVIFAALKALYNWSQGLNSWVLFNTAEHILNDKIDKLNQVIKSQQATSPPAKD